MNNLAGAVIAVVLRLMPRKSKELLNKSERWKKLKPGLMETLKSRLRVAFIVILILSQFTPTHSSGACFVAMGMGKNHSKEIE